MWFEKKKYQILLLATFCGLSFFINNGITKPSIMEARNFITAREILESGSWLIPTMNGEYRLAKPPLPTWITAFSGLLVGNIHHEVALRWPAALMGTIMIFCLYGFARTLTDDKLVPFLAAAVLSTSFYMVFMARQGTWDIYCHSLMLAAIWAFSVGLKKKQHAYGEFLLAGVLMGLSFMSKGPVAFFALLLPFLISYMVAFGTSSFQEKWRELTGAAIVCFIISSWWPLYTYFQVPAELLLNINTETGSWQNRHVRPFYHYWNFPVQSGIWTIFITATLVVFYAKERINKAGGNYKFMIWWVLSTIVLLSLIPEKKERYLMPGLVSQALITAYYIKYLIDSYASNSLTLSDKIILGFNTGIMGVISLAVPFVLYIKGFSHEKLPLMVFVGCSLIFILFGIFFLVQLRKTAPIKIVGAVIVLGCFLSLTSPYLVNRMFAKEITVNNFNDLPEDQTLAGLPYYSIGDLRPEEIWDTRKIVTPLSERRLSELKTNQSIVLFRMVTDEAGGYPQIEQSTKALGVYQHPSRGNNLKWYVDVVKVDNSLLSSLRDQVPAN